MLAIKIKVFFMFLSTILHIVIGILVYLKNRENRINIAFAILALLRAVYIFAYGWDYLYILFHYFFPYQIPHHWPYLFFSRLTYIAIPAVTSWLILLLHLKSQDAKRLKLFMWFLYTPAIIMFLLAMFTTALLKEVVFVYPTLIGVHGYLKGISALYILGILCAGFVNLLHLYIKNRSGLKRLQIKYLTIGMFIESVGDIVVFGILPIFNIYTYSEVAPFFLSIFTIGFTAYAIIRHRFLEIETVIHKTFLWLLASSLFFVPLCALFYYIHPWLNQIGVIGFSFLIIAMVYFYALYYRKVQPLINHWFRRKEYDYHQMLLEIGEKLTREINIDIVATTLLREITAAMYLRNGVIYLEIKGNKGYKWQTDIGYGTGLLPSEAAGKDIDITRDYGRVIEYLRQNPEILEQQQFSFNPQYEKIKETGEKLFATLSIEVLVPLVVENQLLGILGLGKKESLKPYTLKDIEVLEKLARVTSLALFNALHHQEIMEKEHLAEALRLRRRKQIERKILSYQEQLRKLMNELLITEQRERARLALALHDNITQNLAVSKLKLGELSALPKPAEVDHKLQTIAEVLGETLQYVRSYTFELSPPVLHEIGLEAALDTLFEKLQEKYKIVITLKTNQSARQLAPQLAVLLYEVVRELLMNVIKHAQASSAAVEIEEKKNHLSILVQDNGKGFAIDESTSFSYRAGHLGLFSVRERLTYVGGNIKIHSKIGEGTGIFVTVPLESRDIGSQ